MSEGMDGHGTLSWSGRRFDAQTGTFRHMSEEATPFADVLAERDRLRAVVQRVEEITAEVEDDESIGIPPHVPLLVEALRDAVRAPSPSADRTSTQSDAPTVAGRYEAAGGDSDGV